MTALVSGRISAAKTGWIMVALMVGWVLFLLLPFGPEKKTESVKVAELRPGEAELEKAGLPYNVDWIGLPDYFALWANHSKWSDDRAWFAYWNPVTSSYSDSFEVIRDGRSYRFRPITRAELNARLNHLYEQGGGELVDALPEPDGETATHPFLFPSDNAFKIPMPRPHDHPHTRGGPVFREGLSSHVKVDLTTPEFVLPKPAAIVVKEQREPKE